MTKIRSTNGSRVQDNRAATARATAEARKRAAVRDIKSRSASAQNKPSNPGLYPKPIRSTFCRTLRFLYCWSLANTIPPIRWSLPRSR